MNDWEYDMWWDAIQSLDDDNYDDMDDWQGSSPTFSGKYRGYGSYEIFSYVKRPKRELHIFINIV